jgi:hypothetical protein
METIAFDEQLIRNFSSHAEARELYLKQDELLHLEKVIPTEKLEKVFIPAAQRLKQYIHRNYIPFHKKGGSISSFTLSQKAPEFIELYKNRKLKKYLENITGRKLTTCPSDDPHSCALYYYTEGEKQLFCQSFDAF